MKRKNVAYFISPHGFGHAARSAAIMQSLADRLADIHFDVFTSVPAWFFLDSFSGSFSYHRLQSDIGLVQDSALAENLEQTIEALDSFIPFADLAVSSLAEQILCLGCKLVLCDICPLGIAVAERAGLASVLIENFTWDWIYRGYLDREPRLASHIEYLARYFSRADYRIQTEPVCQLQPADLLTDPISRSLRTNRKDLRCHLGLGQDDSAVILTMGGMREVYGFLDRLRAQPDIQFIVPGASQDIQRQANILHLPFRSPIFHPDLINASDAVIGKLGYSTVAEVFQSGVPFGFIRRPSFRESPVIEAYIDKNLAGFPISEEDFRSGDFVASIAKLFRLPRPQKLKPNGAEAAAAFILSLLS